jgi:ATP-binding cassette, subfamily B, bacterial
MSLFWRIPRAQHLKRAIALVWKAAPRWTFLNFVLVGLQAGMPLLQLYLMKLMVDAVTAGIAAPEKKVALSRALLLICLTGGAALAAMFLASIAKVTAQAQTDIVTDHVQDMLHAKSVDLDLEYYEDYRFYDTLHRAQQEAPFRPTRIVNGLVQVAQNGVSLLGIAALLFTCHWGIAAILFSAMIPDVLVRLKFADKMYAWKSKMSVKDRIAGYLNWVLTGETHAKEIRMYDLGPTFTQRFREVRQQLREERVGLALRQGVAELVAQTAAIIAIFGSLAFIAYRTVQGAMTLGDMVMYYQAFQRGQGYLRETLGGMADLYENNLFLSNFYDFLDLKPTIIEPRPPIPVPKPIRSGIVFDHVSFRYPTGAGMVLNDINLTIRPGQVVAFVGENGSGKTTLAKLLCRLYDPTSGSITVDGIDLRSVERKALRSEIGIIFQDYAHYEMTARENIWTGNIRLPLKDEKIVEAAKRSGAHDIMTGLPQGYDTTLGKRFEHGAELSVGQWQKVALARAFLRDAQIIVLDEPTSSMDAKAEYAVFKNFRQLVSDRTGILISHRFSSIRMADHIYVLKGGKIIEEGSHEELIGCGGTYAQLFEIQAQFYR